MPNKHIRSTHGAEPKERKEYYKSLYEGLCESGALFVLCILFFLYIVYAALGKSDLSSSILVLFAVTFILETARVSSGIRKKMKESLSDELYREETIVRLDMELRSLIIAVAIFNGCWSKKSFKENRKNLTSKEFNVKYLSKKYLRQIITPSRNGTAFSLSNRHDCNRLDALLRHLREHLRALETLPIRYQYYALNRNNYKYRLKLEMTIAVLRNTVVNGGEPAYIISEVRASEAKLDTLQNSPSGEAETQEEAEKIKKLIEKLSKIYNQLFQKNLSDYLTEPEESHD